MPTPDPDAPVIRRAEPTDADSVGLLTERIYREGGWADERYSEVLLDGRSRVREAIVLVATVRDVVAATVTIALPGTRFVNVGGADEVEVRMLAVDESVRCRGVATLLMDAAESLARERGFAGVVLSTEPDMHAARRLYEGRGYVRMPGRDWYLNGTRLMVYRRGV